MPDELFCNHRWHASRIEVHTGPVEHVCAMGVSHNLNGAPHKCSCGALADLSAEPLSITCPRCGRRSYNITDVYEGYCGACHDWTSAPMAVQR